MHSSFLPTAVPSNRDIWVRSITWRHGVHDAIDVADLGAGKLQHGPLK